MPGFVMAMIRHQDGLLRSIFVLRLVGEPVLLGKSNLPKARRVYWFSCAVVQPLFAFLYI